MRSDLTLLTEQIAQAPPKNLVWNVARFPGLDHYTTLPSAFGVGLRWLSTDGPQRLPGRGGRS